MNLTALSTCEYQLTIWQHYHLDTVYHYIDLCCSVIEL